MKSDSTIATEELALTDHDMKVSLRDLLKSHLRGEKTMTKAEIITALTEMVREMFGRVSCQLDIDHTHSEGGMYMRHGMGLIQNPSTGNTVRFSF